MTAAAFFLAGLALGIGFYLDSPGALVLGLIAFGIGIGLMIHRDHERNVNASLDLLGRERIAYEDEGTQRHHDPGDQYAWPSREVR